MTNPRNNHTWDLTPERKRQLDTCADNGLTLTAACKTLGFDRKTLARAAERQNLTDWLQERFPPSRIRSTLKRRIPQAKAQSIQLQYATMAWKKPAPNGRRA